MSESRFIDPFSLPEDLEAEREIQKEKAIDADDLEAFDRSVDERFPDDDDIDYDINDDYVPPDFGTWD